MKTRPNDYAPWLITQTVEEYTNSQVLPVAAEIDNVGLTALKDVFLSPAGITLEVLYLDRSEGSEVNMHRFSPVNHGGYDIGTVRLLYRPSVQSLLPLQTFANTCVVGTTTCSTWYKTSHRARSRLLSRRTSSMRATRTRSPRKTSACLTS